MKTSHIARPVKLRHTRQWGASVPGHDVQPGQFLVIETRSGARKLGVVRSIVHRAGDETIVSLVSPAISIPRPETPQ